MDLGTDIERRPRGELLLVHQDLGRCKALVDSEVGTGGVAHPPFVRVRVAAERELETLPLEQEAHRAVQRVDRRDRADGDAVLLVDHFVLGLVVELMDLDLETPYVDVAQPRSLVPGVHLLHVLDHVLGAILGRLARGTPDAKRLDAIAGDTTDPQRIQIADVIGVEVS